MEQGNEVASQQGVQQLIDRIRGEGVKAGREEAERLVREAKQEAASARSSAQAEAREMIDRARGQIERERSAGIEALRNAARDAALELKANVRSEFERYVHRLVSTQMQDTGFLRSLVLILAGQAAERYVNDRDAQIFVSSTLAGDAGGAPSDPSVREKVRNAVLGASAALLREGVQILPDDHVAGGARVRLVGEDLEIDLTDAAVTRLLLKHLLPRYRAIVEEEPV